VREEAARSAFGGAGDLARQRSCAAGFFVPEDGRSDMANHLTPDELSKEVGIDRD
jgi:hypothetical protein